MSQESYLPLDSPGRMPAQAQDIPRQIKELIEDWHQGMLVKPAHQRAEGIWGFKRQRQFILSMCDVTVGKQPLGVIATYELVRDGLAISPCYLNDGLQRITSIVEAFNAPDRFAMDDVGVRSLLRQNITVQHRHYADHLEAMQWFQRLNYGTQLTPYEHCQGYFTYWMPNYTTQWEPFFEELSAEVIRVEHVLAISTRKASRETQHKSLRHHYALLLRFLLRDANPSSYPDVTAGRVGDEIEAGTATEQLLIKALLAIGRESAGVELKKFATHLRSFTNELRDATREALGDGWTMDAGLMRWLLDASIFRRNARVPVQRFHDFVVAMLAETQGRARWERRQEADIYLRLANLQPLTIIADDLGFPDIVTKPKRSKPKTPLRIGMDLSHDQPFVTHGDGPASPEPASLNRARGAKPRSE